MRRPGICISAGERSRLPACGMGRTGSTAAPEDPARIGDIDVPFSASTLGQLEEVHPYPARPGGRHRRARHAPGSPREWAHARASRPAHRGRAPGAARDGSPAPAAVGLARGGAGARLPPVAVVAAVGDAPRPRTPTSTSVETVLEREHLGLTKAKERILEYLAVRRLKPDLPGPALCLVGPPGTGKTSLGAAVARALQPPVRAHQRLRHQRRRRAARRRRAPRPARSPARSCARCARPACATRC